jgi:hypothetical protein
MICEKCQKKINKVLEVRWINPLESGYCWKQFEFMDALIEWVEINKKSTVALVVAKLRKKSEGKKS